MIDQILEKAWGEFGDTPINDDEEIEEAFIIDNTWRFPVGTDRFVVWDFFDEQHSEGVEYLLINHSSG